MTAQISSPSWTRSLYVTYMASPPLPEHRGRMLKKSRPRVAGDSTVNAYSSALPIVYHISHRLTRSKASPLFLTRPGAKGIIKSRRGGCLQSGRPCCFVRFCVIARPAASGRIIVLQCQTNTKRFTAWGRLCRRSPRAARPAEASEADRLTGRLFGGSFCFFNTKRKI